ncbi:calpain-B-like isoform X6 [Ruditapes philippinarum]|uniref:calpain-B-like isoform X6 n=1 Tax=Ruditapes philippinarum TaxID=129788 RepID=UPI00295B77C7|nr:calpain-B-like isoform X6 [Ruditapes philippinarum]
MPFRTTRTVRTTRPDGTVETRTYTDGDDGGSFGGGMMDFGGFRNKFGNMKISFGGGDSGDGGYSYSLGGGGRQTQRGCVSGRSHRKEKKNPFAGLGKQSYEEIVKKCKEEGCLFEDPEFPAEDASIFFSKSPPRPFEWKRPSEICDDPKYVTGGASRFDVQQGELGDCWLLAAVASLTCNSHLLNKIIIPEQDFSGDNYCGVFKFNFWHQGDWIQVVVDDRLPTYYGNLVFMHSTDKNEFWSALLEKAYAKLSGSYECLKGGSTSEAMEDFTGGVTESVDLQKAPTNLLNIMMKAHARGSLMGCSIDADPSQLEAICDNGLVMGHAYSVTSVKLVEIQTPKVSGKIPLVRVRNPWGNESEWNGAWSDKSAEWTYIPDDEKRSLGLTFDDDGEFWMSFQDWQNNFQKLEICNLGPDSLDEEEMSQGKIRWEATAERGEWIPRVNAGGCRNYLETFATNPQYRVVLTDPDDDEDDLCTMLVGLLQKDRRKKRKEGLDMLTIGYVIYKMKEDGSFGSGPLDCRFFKYNASVAKSPSFINMREICGRHKLSPGTYVIIPSTFEPNQQGEFLLRIFTEKAGTSEEMDEGTSLVDNQIDSEIKACVAAGPLYQVKGQPTAPKRGTSSHSGMRSAHRSPSPVIHTYEQAIEFLTKQWNQEAPPMTEEDQAQGQELRESFKRIAGSDLEVDAYELRDILNSVFTKGDASKFKFDGFGLDVCRSMVAMHDGDLSGKLGFDEFKQLWQDLRKWKAVFKEFDKDNSGLLSTYELRGAFRSSGFKLSNRSLSAIILRFSNKKGEIEFDDFVLCAIRLKTMIASFKAYDQQGQGVAAYDIDTFIQTTMYS